MTTTAEIPAVAETLDAIVEKLILHEPEFVLTRELFHGRILHLGNGVLVELEMPTPDAIRARMSDGSRFEWTLRLRSTPGPLSNVGAMVSAIIAAEIQLAEIVS